MTEATSITVRVPLTIRRPGWKTVLTPVSAGGGDPRNAGRPDAR
jgi:hypothetical protein